MSNTVAFPIQAADPAPRTALKSEVQDAGVAKTTLPPAADIAADFRLVIEEDQATGSFIYKTLDRRTGEVVQQFPREEVLRLRSAPEYEPGQIIETLR